MKLQISKKEQQDFETFYALSKDREICFHQANKKPIISNYRSNDLARNLHPGYFWVRIKDIKLETNDTKTFILEADRDHGTNRLPRFQAGQYITLQIPLGKGMYIRPYSLSSSFKEHYQITIKRVLHGKISTYFWNTVRIGDTFLARGPYGNFVYQPIRDSEHIVALVGGSGIIPIKAIAEDIVNNKIAAKMTILYGAKTKDDLIFRTELNEYVKTCSNIKVVYVLSEEKKDGYEHGFITRDLILKYQETSHSYFVCGTIPFYQSMNKILKSMDVPNKYIRHDSYMEHDIPEFEEKFDILILSSTGEQKISCKGNQTLMDAMEHEGVIIPKKCGVGVCGYCRSKLIRGEVLTNYDYVRKADKKHHYIHPCSTYPLTNLIIQLPN